jgi:hypothetical protein
MMAITESDHRPVGFYAAGAPNAESEWLWVASPARACARRSAGSARCSGLRVGRARSARSQGPAARRPGRNRSVRSAAPGPGSTVTYWTPMAAPEAARMVQTQTAPGCLLPVATSRIKKNAWSARRLPATICPGCRNRFRGLQQASGAGAAWRVGIPRLMRRLSRSPS